MPRLRYSVLLILLSSIMLIASCQDNSNSSSGSSNGSTTLFNKKQLIYDIAHHVMLPSVEQFLLEAEKLHSTLDITCEDSRDLAAAQEQWKPTMNAWQRLEILQVGVLHDDDNSLRNIIYSWPVTNACAVDQDTIKIHDDLASYNVESALLNRKGLDALEYLLFHDEPEHQCPLPAAPKTWGSLEVSDISSARCEYSKKLSQDLLTQAQTLQQAWSPEAGNDVNHISLETEDSRFESEDAVLNHFLEGIFYLDTKVKDVKLGRPLGIMQNSCSVTNEACLEDLELAFSQHSLESLKINLQTFEALMLGSWENQGIHVGFSHFLEASEAGHVARMLENAIQESLEQIDMLPKPLSKALTEDYDGVKKLYDHVKLITDTLKTDFVGFLFLEIPAQAAGDAD